MNSFEKYRGLAHLTLLCVIMPLLAWKLALGGTVGGWFEVRRVEKELIVLREKVLSATSAPSIAVSTTGEHIRDGELLGDILCGPGCCEVVKYTPYTCGGADGLTLYTAEIVLNTDFLSAVRIMDNIERTMPSSRLRSVTLRTVLPRGSKQPQLYAMLIVQQITDSR